MEEEGTFFSSIHEASITLVSKSDEALKTIKIKTTDQHPS